MPKKSQNLRNWRSVAELVGICIFAKLEISENCIFEKIQESPKSMMIPLILLALGSIFVGVFFKDLFIGHDSCLLYTSDAADE